MREILRTSDGVIIAALQQELDAADVPFQVTHEVGNVYLNVMELVVWIPRNADMQAVEKAFERVRQRHAARMGKASKTQVSVSDAAFHCDQCGYNLRGQIEDGRCPECGHPYAMALPRKCPHCGETSPADFAICWQCGGDLIEDRDTPQEADPENPPADSAQKA